MSIEQFLNENIWLFIITLVWVLPWKAWALWVASKRDEKWWFVLILVLNTFAIVEIFYIFFIAKKKPSDILNAFKSKIRS